MILSIDIVVSDIAEGEKATYDYRLFNDVGEWRSSTSGATRPAVRLSGASTIYLKSLKSWDVKISSAMESINVV